MENIEMKLKPFSLSGFKDQDGNVVIPCQWKDVQFFSEGLAAVQDANDKWGFIDKTGEVVTPCQWSNVSWFRNGKVKVQDVRYGKYHVVNITGKSVE